MCSYDHLQSEQFKFSFTCLPVAQDAFCVRPTPKISRGSECQVAAKVPTPGKCYTDRL